MCPAVRNRPTSYRKMVERNHSEADLVLFVESFLIQTTIVARFYSGNDVRQVVPLSSLMINLPVKFIRGNFEYFLGRLNNVFYEEAKCPSVVCFNNITFRTNILCQFNNF